MAYDIPLFFCKKRIITPHVKPVNQSHMKHELYYKKNLKNPFSEFTNSPMTNQCLTDEIQTSLKSIHLTTGCHVALLTPFLYQTTQDLQNVPCFLMLLYSEHVTTA